jgi:6-phosphogluconolactonase (cycloisomerase 2 family)
MKFRKFGKTVLTAAFSAAIAFSLSSCIRSFTSGYLYVTGTVTSTPNGNGIISGFKIDNNTGKLNVMHGLPVSSGGANPVRIVLPTGGRFVYVLNRGANAAGGSVCTTADPCLNSNVQQFVVGGNGILTPQETFFTQGINPFRLIVDPSGLFLLALDHDAPSNAYCSTVVTGATSCGDVTVFAINQTTGRLSLVTNAQLTASVGSQVTYFPVPANPIDFVLASSFVMTLSGDPSSSSGQTVYPYGYSSSTGQLTVSQSTPQVITNGSGNPMKGGTAIVFAGGKVYVLDNEAITATNNGTTTTAPSQILPYTVGTNGALQALTGGAVPGDPTLSSPIYLIVESKGKFLYVVNQLGASTSTGAGIAGYSISPQDAELSVDPGSPWGTGAGPQCLLEDPSNQYIYTANATDSTITGRLLDPNSGALRNLNGSSGVFPLNGPPTWCVTTGRTN